MSRYMLVYAGSGQAGPPPDMSPEQVQETMAAWGAWMEKVGPALADPGFPTGARGSVGGSGTPAGILGYSVVEADDLDSAKAHCDGHPFLDGAPEDFRIDVYELVPMSL